MRLLRSKWFWVVCVVLVALSGGAAYWHAQQPAAAQYQTPEEADAYVRFDMEAYDKIKQNYWQAAGDPDLSQLFLLSVQKVAGSQYTLATSTRLATAQMLSGAFAQATSTEAKKQLALNVLIVALYNLSPQGRDSILSSKEETALRQTVSNINPASNLYADLGTTKDATRGELDAAYKQKAAQLAAATTSEAQAQAKQVAYAHDVLSKTESKTLYDQAQIEPTVFAHVLGRTLYLNISKMSPTTLQEFGLAVEGASTTQALDSIILDLRGNVGGALDFLQKFLGLFIGANQYAFDLFHQGAYDVQRTTLQKFDGLARYKQVAVLVDNMTQSTAELTAATLKKFNLARVVGTTTRGWGTVENTYPLETVIDPSATYSLLLVNSITLRDDNQPIEGRGVTPDIDTGYADWKSQLNSFFTSTSLIAALRAQGAVPPLR